MFSSFLISIIIKDFYQEQYLLQFVIILIKLMITIHQCPHYMRNCHVQSPCCKIFYPCKLCHDQKFQFKKGCQIQRMEPEKVQQIKCLNCQQIQQPTQACSKCDISFGEYTCLKCRLFQNKKNKINDIFHCDDCKMCRRGTKETVSHCHTCGYCIPNANVGHKCIAQNAESKCPICLEVILYSTKYHVTLNCGHIIHNECLAQSRQRNCPSCGMAIKKMSQEQKDRMQEIIEQTKDNLPAQLKQIKVNVLCNQCLHKTMNAPFHFYGMKCQKCGTYNTKKI